MNPINNVRCGQCGLVGLEPGFVEDSGQELPHGFAKWIAGALERGPMGGAKRRGRPRRQIDAYRCPACSHLELFATQRIN